MTVNYALSAVKATPTVLKHHLYVYRMKIMNSTSVKTVATAFITVTSVKAVKQLEHYYAKSAVKSVLKKKDATVVTSA